jgi:hypothetical protein
MSELRPSYFNRDFRESAVRLVLETGKPIAQGPGAGDQRGHAGELGVCHERGRSLEVAG